MKLNKDCVRDLMLYIEDNLSFGSQLDVSQIHNLNYSTDDILYTALKLYEAGYINASVSDYIDGSIYISIQSITWSGHKFIDNIRDGKVWSTTKNIASKFTSVSISMIENIASQVITNLINKSFEQ